MRGSGALTVSDSWWQSNGLRIRFMEMGRRRSPLRHLRGEVAHKGRRAFLHRHLRRAEDSRLLLREREDPGVHLEDAPRHGNGGVIVDAIVLVVALCLMAGGLWLLWNVAAQALAEWREDR